MKKVTIALAKGRLFQTSMQIFQRAGIGADDLAEDSRQLVIHGEKADFLIVKPVDVPVYVEHGVADVGICGKDTLLESEANILEMLDLGFAKCRLCFCGYEKTDPYKSGVRVATKYPNYARKLYRERGISAEVITLSGSVELGPILGLSDVILDIVESGRTLVENGLSILAEVAPISARLCVNRVSLKTKSDMLKPLVLTIRKQLEEADDI
ncbi:ATP phosphoribosyltransferase [Eubacteriales bacterium OttesenSCG-928-M02]|nr:ATP phosphoribosyltransferase [Eubacteriales bacterium OttesenSCG-928-M02]